MVHFHNSLYESRSSCARWLYPQNLLHTSSLEYLQLFNMGIPINRQREIHVDANTLICRKASYSFYSTHSGSRTWKRDITDAPRKMASSIVFEYLSYQGGKLNSWLSGLPLILDDSVQLYACVVNRMRCFSPYDGYFRVSRHIVIPSGDDKRENHLICSFISANIICVGFALSV